MSNALTVTQPAPLAHGEEPHVFAMMQAAIAQGITPEVMKQFIDLRNAEEARRARSSFNSAFVALQADLPVIHATKIIPGKNGEMRSAYAPYEEIMRIVAPLLKRHGFTVSFSTKIEGPRVVAYCTLLHRDGHERTNEYAVRIGSGPPAASEAQADGSAHTYARRGALRDALGITVAGLDNDAREVGAPITDDQAEDLRQRVEALGTAINLDAFWRFAQTPDKQFTRIPASMYGPISDMLLKKEIR